MVRIAQTRAQQHGQISLDCEALREQAKYDDEDALFEHIRDNFTRPLYRGPPDQRLGLTFLQSNKYAVQVVQQVERDQLTQIVELKKSVSCLRQYFTQRDLQQKFDVEERQRLAYQAAITNRREPVTGQSVARQLARSELGGGIYLMERQKPWLSSQEQLDQSFKAKLKEHCRVLQTIQQPIKTSALRMSQTVENDESQPQKSKKGDLFTQIKLVQKMKQEQQQTRNGQIFTSLVNPRIVQSLLQKLSSPDMFATFLANKANNFNLSYIVKNISDTRNFQHLCKKLSTKPIINESDPRQWYFKDCSKALEPPLDLFEHITDKSLQLRDYRLSKGQCFGFNKACQVEPKLLQGCFLDNCGVTDQMLAALLVGFTHQNQFQVLSLKQVEIGHESAEQLKNLLRKYTPYNLQELTVQQCQIKGVGVLQTILDAVDYDSHLHSLALVQQPLDHQNLKTLAKIIAFGKYLTSVDLSYQSLTLPQIAPVFRAICENTKLQFVNLSWNQLTADQNFGDLNSLCVDAEELQSRQTNKKRKLPEKKKTKKSESKSNLFNEQEKFIVQNFQQMLKDNESLLHMDLSECGLSADMILAIIKSVKQTTSLLAVHLSGNPGLSHPVIDSVVERLDAAYEPQLPVKSFLNALQKTETEIISRQKHLSETVQIKKTKHLKQFYYSQVQTGEVNNLQRRHLILTRKLGHRFVIPGGEQWHVFTDSHSQCYICDRKIYCLFLWSPEHPTPQPIQNLNLTHSQKQKILNLLTTERVSCIKRQNICQIDSRILTFNKHLFKHINDDSYELSDQGDKPSGLLEKKLANQLKESDTFDLREVHMRMGDHQPILFGQFNNWQGQPMVKLSKLIHFINRDQQPDIIAELKQQGQLRPDIGSFADMIYQERKSYKKLLKDWEKSQSGYEIWSRTIQKLVKFTRPFSNWVEQFRNIESSKLYVTAEFVGCGRQDYGVQCGSMFYFNSMIAQFRTESIQIAKLDNNVSKVLRNPNVFKNWQHDTPYLLEQSMRHDIEAWKVLKFVKEPNEYREICLILKQNYNYLAQLHKSISARDSYPTVGLLQVTTILQEADILDQVLSTGIVDTQFIASRADVDKRGYKLKNQNSNEINRFEFFENLVRIAITKYKPEGLSHSESFQKLVTVLIDKIQPYPSQLFREQLLWTREVNLTLDANLEGIQKLYDLYATHNKLHKMSKQQALDLMCHASNFRLSEKDACVCYVLSLQTCAQLIKNSHSCIDHISFIEFLEMIARFADVYMADSADMPLFKKVDYVLDEWLSLAKYTRLEPDEYERGDDSDAEEPTTKSKLVRSKKIKK